MLDLRECVPNGFAASVSELGATVVYDLFDDLLEFEFLLWLVASLLVKTPLAATEMQEIAVDGTAPPQQTG